MSNRIYSKKKQQSVSLTEARIVNLLNALHAKKLSSIVSAVKSVTYYALRTSMAAIAATAICLTSKGKGAQSQPKDYAQPLRISGLKVIAGRLFNGSK